MGNGSAADADGDGGVVGKRRPRAAPNSRRSGFHRSNVVGIGTGKQGRQKDVDVAGLVGVVEVPRKFPRVLSNPVIIGD